MYGSDAPALRKLMREEPALAAALHPALPYTGAEIVWAARFEMARTLEDVLSRRTRALLLNARAAVEMSGRAAALLAQELGRDDEWTSRQVRCFRQIAANYLPGGLPGGLAAEPAEGERGHSRD